MGEAIGMVAAVLAWIFLFMFTLGAWAIGLVQILTWIFT